MNLLRACYSGLTHWHSECVASSETQSCHLPVCETNIQDQFFIALSTRPWSPDNMYLYQCMSDQISNADYYSYMAEFMSKCLNVHFCSTTTSEHMLPEYFHLQGEGVGFEITLAEIYCWIKLYVDNGGCFFINQILISMSNYENAIKIFYWFWNLQLFSQV